MSPEKDIIDIIKSEQLTRIYFNEFAIGLSKNDIFILLRRNGKEEAILNASHISAKSLALALMEAINNLETKIGQPVLTSDEVERLMEDNSNVLDN